MVDHSKSLVNKSRAIKLSLTEVGFFLHKTSSMFGDVWCMLGGSVEVSTKNILYRSIVGQTHLGMPKRLYNEFCP